MFKRLTIFSFALALMVGVGVATTAQATDISGEMIYRWEGFNNYDQTSDVDDALSFSQLRTRVGFGGDIGGNASYMLTLENYRVLGDADNDVNSIYQATFTAKNFLFDSFDVTFGRLPVAYGRERIVGNEEWSMNPDERTIFEGYHGRYSFENGWLDHFNFKLAESYGSKYGTGVGDTDLAGFYMHYDANEAFWFEPYAIMATTENWDVEGADNDKLFMFGSLVDYMQNGLHFYGELTVQSGTTYSMGEQDISAMGYYAGLFYDFDAASEPFIGFEYNFASGQSADSMDAEAFGSPFGSSRDYLGIMNVVPWTNVAAMRFAGGFMPVEGLDVGVDYFMFSTDQEYADGETAIGTELDITLDYMLNEDVDLHGGMGMFTYDEATGTATKSPVPMGYYMDPGDPMIFGWFGASVDF